MLRWFTESKSPVSRAEATVIGIAAFVLACYSRLQSGLRPGVNSPEGFYGFYDQSEYLLIAQRLADFDLPRNIDEYSFGLGYPILAAPFEWLGFEGDPFFPVDTLLFGVAIALTAVVGSRIGGRTCGLAAAALVGLATPLLELVTVPWNSTVSVTALLIALMAATSPSGQSVGTAVVIGLAAGWAFAARYPDGIAIGLVATIPLLIERSRRSWSLVATAAATSLLIVGPVLWSHDVILESWHTTPYASHLRGEEGNRTSDQSIDQYDLGDVPTHFVETFVTARADGVKEPRDPFLLRSPFLVLAPLGLVAVLRRRLPWRRLVTGAAAVSAASSIFYLSFVAGGGGDIKFGNFRYWIMWVPLWTMLAVIAAQAGLGSLASWTRQRHEQTDDIEPDGNSGDDLALTVPT